MFFIPTSSLLTVRNVNKMRNLPFMPTIFSSHFPLQNAELEKARAQGRYMKTFETDILKLRADELNYTLCMFVKEVKVRDKRKRERMGRSFLFDT